MFKTYMPRESMAQHRQMYLVVRGTDKGVHFQSYTAGQVHAALDNAYATPALDNLANPNNPDNPALDNAYATAPFKTVTRSSIVGLLAGEFNLVAGLGAIVW